MRVCQSCGSCTFLRRLFVAQFTTDPRASVLATEYLAYTSVLLLFDGLYFVAFRTLQAAGDMLAPMFISVGAAAIKAGLTLARLARGKWLTDHWSA